MSDFNEDDLFAHEFLAANNYYRRVHKVPELQLSEELNEMAQRWAEKLATSRHIEYCQMAGIGENLTYFPKNLSAADVVEYWYKENKLYEYNTPGWQIGSTYFTQLIWKATKEVGIGVAFVENLKHLNKKTQQLVDDSLNDHKIVVAFYRPGGNNNRAGQFASNVSPPVETEINGYH